MITSQNKIDVHHHIFPPAWLQEATKHIGDAGGFHFPGWSKESALALMDRTGIGTAMASISAPGVYFGNRNVARDLARHCNEYLASLVMQYPRRFGAMAALPLPSVDDALAEIEYAFDSLKVDGVMLLTNVEGTYLGDPAFDAVLDELNRRKAVIFLHPNVPAYSKSLKLTFPEAMIEFLFDTTRTAANLIYSGTMERCPDLKIILPHSGGTLPYVAWRVALSALVPGLGDRAPQGAMAYMKRFYYETAISASPHALGSLHELVDPSHIIFGSDHPYLPEKLIGAVIQGINQSKYFDASARQAIERKNGLELFPRLRELQSEAVNR